MLDKETGAALEPPTWLNKQFIQTAFTNSDAASTNPTVESIAVRAALAVGENYGSDMFRVEVKLQGVSEKRSVIVKILPPGDRGDMVEKVGIFPKEINMFSKTLLKIHKLLDETSPEYHHRFSAKYLYHGETPTKFLVLEDLSVSGFRNVPRRKGLDLVHCSMVIQSLAKFHATSIAVQARDPEEFKPYWKGTYSSDRGNVFGEYVKQSIKSLVVELEKWPEYHSRYASKLLRVSENIYEKLKQEVNYKPGRFNVLIHGDPWVNNFMFKYNGDEPTEMRFVDFQECTLSSPALDLQYFLHTSTNEEVPMHHFDQLIVEYHSTLTNTLRLLGCSQQGLTLEQLKEEFDAHYFFGMFAALSILPLVVADPKLAEDIGNNFENLINLENSLMYGNDIFMQTMLRLLPIFDDKGCFDI